MRQMTQVTTMALVIYGCAMAEVPADVREAAYTAQHGTNAPATSIAPQITPPLVNEESERPAGRSISVAQETPETLNRTAAEIYSRLAEQDRSRAEDLRKDGRTWAKRLLDAAGVTTQPAASSHKPSRRPVSTQPAQADHALLPQTSLSQVMVSSAACAGGSAAQLSPPAPSKSTAPAAHPPAPASRPTAHNVQPAINKPIEVTAPKEAVHFANSRTGSAGMTLEEISSLAQDVRAAADRIDSIGHCVQEGAAVSPVETTYLRRMSIAIRAITGHQPQN